jgi:NRPS condensation-like uncharacterized protein
MSKIIKLRLSQDALDVLENYAYFHQTTIDDIADGAILMFPFYEQRTKQIREMMEK